MKSLAFVVLASTFVLTAAGCPGEEGEVCFEDGDCSSGLVCCKTTTSVTARGRCYASSASCSTGPGPDSSADTGTDGGDSSTDASTDAPADAPDTTPMDATMGCDPALAECGEGYCRLASCGDSMGECVDRPLRCDGVLEPACGCDGRTYTSECEAGRSGVSVDHAGACGSASDTGVMDASPDASDASTSG